MKLTISKVAVFGAATPSRCHSPENSSGHIEGQENVKTLTIIFFLCFADRASQDIYLSN